MVVQRLKIEHPERASASVRDFANKNRRPPGASRVRFFGNSDSAAAGGIYSSCFFATCQTCT